jgi:hypothetical protein
MAASFAPSPLHTNMQTSRQQIAKMTHALGVEVLWIFLGNRQLGFERVPQRQPEHKHQQMHVSTT